eukprot:SAG22_NODE_932_length_6448_cov_7.053709_5_plen_48_part_00
MGLGGSGGSGGGGAAFTPPSEPSRPPPLRTGSPTTEEVGNPMSGTML